MSNKFYVGENGKTVCQDGKIVANCDLGNNLTRTDGERKAVALRIVNCLNACAELLDVRVVKEIWNFSVFAVEQLEDNERVVVLPGSGMHTILRQNLVEGRGNKWKERIYE